MVRVKRRYVLFEVIPNDTPFDPMGEGLAITERALIEAIRLSVAKLFGDFGLGSVLQALQLKRFNNKTRTGVLATKRTVHLMVVTALAFVTRVEHLDCIIRTIHKSGTIRGCLKVLHIHHNKQIQTMRTHLNAIQVKNIQKGVKDIESALLVGQHLSSTTDVLKNENQIL